MPDGRGHARGPAYPAQGDRSRERGDEDQEGGSGLISGVKQAGSTSWGTAMMPGPAARRGPLIVPAALGALWIAHWAAASFAFRPGPYESGILTLLTMLAAALYVVRR